MGKSYRHTGMTAWNGASDGVSRRNRNRCGEGTVVLGVYRATLNLEDIEKEAAWAAAVCERNGLEKVSLASYLMPAQLADIERLLEAAKHNGFQMIRLFPDKYTGADRIQG